MCIESLIKRALQYTINANQYQRLANNLTFMLLTHQSVRKCVKNTEYTVYIKLTIEFNKSHYKYNEASYSMGLSCLALAHVDGSVIYQLYHVHSWFACISTLSSRACGPWASGGYIRQTTRAHGITIKYHISKIHYIHQQCMHT